MKFDYPKRGNSLLISHRRLKVPAFTDKQPLSTNLRLSLGYNFIIAAF